MGIPLASKPRSLPSRETDQSAYDHQGSSEHSSPSRRSSRAKLSKRCQSMPVAVAANDENNHHPIEKKRQSKLRTSFRFTRSMRLLSKRSQSMPVESVTTTTTPACEQPGQGLSARSEGKKRTRRITSLGFLRRSYSVSVLHSSDSNSISKASKGSKGSSATEDCQLSDEEQPGQSLMERTKIIAEQSSTRGIDEELKDIIEEEEGLEQVVAALRRFFSTLILRKCAVLEILACQISRSRFSCQRILLFRNLLNVSLPPN